MNLLKLAKMGYRMRNHKLTIALKKIKKRK